MRVFEGRLRQTMVMAMLFQVTRTRGSMPPAANTGVTLANGHTHRQEDISHSTYHPINPTDLPVYLTLAQVKPRQNRQEAPLMSAPKQKWTGAKRVKNVANPSYSSLRSQLVPLQDIHGSQEAMVRERESLKSWKQS